MSAVGSQAHVRTFSPKVFSRLAATLGLTGLMLVSFELASNLEVLCVWFFSNVAWIVYSIRIREWEVLAQNAGFLVMGIIGIVRLWP